MIAFEHANKNLQKKAKEKKIKRQSFTYKDLPVIHLQRQEQKN